jgi:type IV pilus assembly PilX-like protein
MMHKYKTFQHYQRGAAALIVSVILLIGVTLIILFEARVGILDQQISGNEFRHKEAFANAEAGLEQAASFLSANTKLHEGEIDDGWALCTGLTAEFPCSIAGAQMVYATVTPSAITSSSVDWLDVEMPDVDAFLVKTSAGTVAIGQGVSDDGTGAAVVQVTFAQARLLVTSDELPPLMLPTGDLSGNFNVVPNPNGGGPGVPVSVWAKDTLDTTGSNWKTCDHGEFKDATDICEDTKGDGATGDDWQGCSCDVERSNSTDVNEDIVLYSNAAFPNSPFAYVFGGEDDISDAEVVILKAEIKARAQATGLVLANCTNLVSEFANLNTSALVWVEGDCSIGSNITVASRDKPIILVVEGELRVNAGAETWGILVGLDDFVLNGGPVIHGSAISDVPSDLTNGNYSQVYDVDVLTKLRDESINTEMTKLQYSWRDFTP